ncbi:MAG: tRNA (adenosine(37)-N6)-threonylcarbamoyltransferase complex ATPase subunit type 1 TsaE [Candidatus Marinimicrobia bacterium]|nr:tRNA (adenosine(37)-N6)-threonylcarbamoyltransferase complex ATPase subunit type 1 TsaE [Candidatus Neomarinimicrobiota bacterium]
MSISHPAIREAKFATLSPEETFNEGKKFASRLNGGEVIALVGELGAGKTVFTKGLCEGLNVKNPVISPTFTIVNEYDADLKIYHFDAYRLSGSEEAAAIGIEDYMKGDAVCIIEWADKVKEVIPEEATWIYLYHNKDSGTGRLLKIVLFGDR